MPIDWYQVALDRLGWHEITLWYRTRDGYEFNHLEIGHAKGDAPIPKSPEQKRAWSGGHWSKRLWFGTFTPVRHVLPGRDDVPASVTT
jgi:hypothetical protein